VNVKSRSSKMLENRNVERPGKQRERSPEAAQREPRRSLLARCCCGEGELR